MTELPRQSSADDGTRLVAIVMSERAALQLRAACRWGWFRAQDWLDSPPRGTTASAIARAAEAREWLEWGDHWLQDGQRIDVPPDPHAAGEIEVSNG
jgi:hypothetical protein